MIFSQPVPLLETDPCLYQSREGSTAGKKGIGTGSQTSGITEAKGLGLIPAYSSGPGIMPNSLLVFPLRSCSGAHEPPSRALVGGCCCYKGWLLVTWTKPMCCTPFPQYKAKALHSRHCRVSDPSIMSASGSGLFC